MPQNAASDQVLHCLLTEVSLMKSACTTKQPLKRRWAGPYRSGNFGLKGLTYFIAKYDTAMGLGHKFSQH